MSFARAFLLFFPLVFILLSLLKVSAGRLVFNSLLFSLMLAWVTRVLSRGPRRCVDSLLFDFEQRRRAERRRFSGRLKEAEKMLGKGETAAAAAKVDGVLSESPLYPEALYLKALIRWERGDREGALADLRLAMQNAAVEETSFRKASELHARIMREGG